MISGESCLLVFFLKSMTSVFQKKVPVPSSALNIQDIMLSFLTMIYFYKMLFWVSLGCKSFRTCLPYLPNTVTHHVPAILKHLQFSIDIIFTILFLYVSVHLFLCLKYLSPHLFLTILQVYLLSDAFTQCCPSPTKGHPIYPSIFQQVLT